MQQSKNQKIASNPSQHSKSKHKRYQEGGPQDKNGYRNFNLSHAQKECLDIIRNNVITFVEGNARNREVPFSFICSSYILFS